MGITIVSSVFENGWVFENMILGGDSMPYFLFKEIYSNRVLVQGRRWQLKIPGISASVYFYIAQYLFFLGSSV